MNFVLRGHGHVTAVQTVIQVFYQNEAYARLEEIPENGTAVLSEMSVGRCYAAIYSDGCVINEKHAPLGPEAGIREQTQALAKVIYLALSEITGKTPPWGTITGVRPAKIVWELREAGFDDTAVFDYFANNYLTRRDKTGLCIQVAETERKILSALNDGIGVYAGIPFCPSKCRYCSFSSESADAFSSYIDDYLEALSKELKFLGKCAESQRINAVYIGGGTPAVLEPYRLEKLLYEMNAIFDAAGTAEFSLEAGRPDCVTAEKLHIMKKYGVTRISVNPQTLNDETLEKIGRKHTSADFVKAFLLAQDAGFDNINCDVILGLEGETPDDVSRTFDGLESLGPASVTVHTLAVKRAAEINRTFGRFADGTAGKLTKPEIVEEMLDISRKRCHEMRMKPYYMYRQKNMLGNFENVGYAREGFESVYNIQTMTERQSVLAAGAGAVTKIVDAETRLIRRAFNVKSIPEYIGRIDEMIERKVLIL